MSSVTVFNVHARLLVRRVSHFRVTCRQHTIGILKYTPRRVPRTDVESDAAHIVNAVAIIGPRYPQFFIEACSGDLPLRRSYRAYSNTASNHASGAMARNVHFPLGAPSPLALRLGGVIPIKINANAILYKMARRRI